MRLTQEEWLEYTQLLRWPVAAIIIALIVGYFVYKSVDVAFTRICAWKKPQAERRT